VLASGLTDAPRALIPLADGSLLVVWARTRATVYEPDGTVRWDRTPDPAVAGDSLVDDALLMAPEGVLYYASYAGLNDAYWFVAVEVGVAPAPFVWRGSGSNWARSGD
jgi:hypothetical protein